MLFELTQLITELIVCIKFCNRFYSVCNYIIIFFFIADKDLYITFSGKKLLLAKTWGFVRHPNYLGHIMVLVSFSLALLWSAPFNVISFLPLIISVIFLLHRAARDGRQCEKKHGASWTRYCNVVKYKIVPHIY